MTADKRGQGGVWRILVPVLGGAGLMLLLLRLGTPSAPPTSGSDEYTFQPEPRRAKIDLGASSGALSGQTGTPPVPLLETASCESLQQFANYEYDKRYREGKLNERMSFSGFEGADVFVSDGDMLNCAGGEFVRTGKGKGGERRCKNVILSYDTGTNTLTYNVQYIYLERGLQPQCSGPS